MVELNPSKAHYVVATVIIVKDGKYLITKRADWKNFALQIILLQHFIFGRARFFVPGGKLETKDYINKKPDTCAGQWYNVLETLAKREVFEETGLSIKDTKYLTSLTFIRPDGIPTLVISLYADYDSGEVKLSKDMTVFNWVTLEEAKSYDLIDGIYEEIEILDSHLKGERLRSWGKN